MSERRWALAASAALFSGAALAAVASLFLALTPTVEAPAIPPITAATENPGTARVNLIANPGARPLPGPTGRLKIPGILDAELGAMGVTNGRVSPPDFERAFIVEGYGSPREATGSTVFVVMHSSASLPAIGSALVHEGQPVVKPGAEIVVDGVQFRATEAFFVAKPDLTGVDRLWAGSADLVILSCRPRPGGAVENLVIVAERVVVDGLRPDAF